MQPPHRNLLLRLRNHPSLSYSSLDLNLDLHVVHLILHLLHFILKELDLSSHRLFSYFLGHLDGIGLHLVGLHHCFFSHGEALKEDLALIPIERI